MSDTPLDILQIKIERAKENLPPETRKAIDSVDWRAVILDMRERKGYSLEQLEALELETELVLCGLSMPENYPKQLEETMEMPRPQVDLLVQEMNELVFKKIKDELIRNNQRKDIFIKRTEEIINKAPIINKNSNVIAIDEHITSPNIFNAKEPIKVVEDIKLSPTFNPKINTEIPNTSSNTIKNDVIEKKIITENKIIPQIEDTAINKIDIKSQEKIPKENTIDSMLAQKFSGPFQMKATTTEYSLNNLSKEKEKNDLLQKNTSVKITTSKVDPYRLDPNDE